MSLIVKALQLYVPQTVKKQRLERLFTLTADAFQAQSPDTSGLSFDEALLQYALFTREEAEKAIRRSDGLPVIRDRLYRSARQMGQELRNTLRVGTPQQAASAFQLLYRVLGIESSAHFPGEVLITRCFFSRFYSAEVCQLISALDAGVAAGLSGGGSLTFDQRITEGSECCRARFM